MPRRTTAAALGVLVLCTTAPALAASTEPVRTWGAGGTADLVPEPGASVDDLALDPGGRVHALVSRPGGAASVHRLTGTGASDPEHPVVRVTSWDPVALAAAGEHLLLVGDDSERAATGDVVVTRLSATGTVDTSFGDDGTVRVDLGVDEFAVDAVALPDGGVVVAGGRHHPASGLTEPLLLALDSAGRRDPWFGTDGVRTGLPAAVPTDGAYTSIDRDPTTGQLLTLYQDAPEGDAASGPRLHLLDRTGLAQPFGSPHGGHSHRTPALTTAAQFVGGLPGYVGAQEDAAGRAHGMLVQLSRDGLSQTAALFHAGTCEAVLLGATSTATGTTPGVVSAVGLAECGTQERLVVARAVVPRPGELSLASDRSFGEHGLAVYPVATEPLAVAWTALDTPGGVLLGGVSGRTAGGTAATALVRATGAATLSVGVSAPALVPAGTGVTVSGGLVRPVTGQPATSRIVLVQRKAPTSTTWTTVSRTQSQPDGSVVHVDRAPRGTHDYRLLVPAAPGIAQSTSASRRVKVDQVFTAALSTARVRRGASVSVRGTVDPYAGQSVRLERWTGRAWAAVSTKRLTARSYAFAVPSSTVGTHRYRVVKLSGNGWAQRTSSALTLTVVR